MEGGRCAHRRRRVFVFRAGCRCCCPISVAIGGRGRARGARTALKLIHHAVAWETRWERGAIRRGGGRGREGEGQGKSPFNSRGLQMRGLADNGDREQGAPAQAVARL